MASYAGQCILVALLLRWPLDIILRFEVWFCGTALVLNACTGKHSNSFLFCMEYWKIQKIKVKCKLLTISITQKYFSAGLMFLSVVIFYAQCWARDWLLYPNWNYPSWSYAFACFTCVGHCIATIFLYWVSSNCVSIIYVLKI